MVCKGCSVEGLVVTLQRQLPTTSLTDVQSYARSVHADCEQGRKTNRRFRKQLGLPQA